MLALGLGFFAASAPQAQAGYESQARRAVRQGNRLWDDMSPSERREFKRLFAKEGKATAKEYGISWSTMKAILRDYGAKFVMMPTPPMGPTC
jgi:hypothetical protein